MELLIQKMQADYSGIHSEVRYYVPLDRRMRCGMYALPTHLQKERELTVTGYAEFTNNSNYMSRIR